MTVMTQSLSRPEIVYPDSDGEPMADNTLQYQWITKIKGNLEIVFKDDPQVFVAGDLLWYPVEGKPKIRTAPDTMVVFGRPKGDRGSYMQWLENDIPPQVVFEILSPGNRAARMTEKAVFYQRYGVEEYYIYDPDEGELSGLLNKDGAFVPIADMHGWVSPRLKCRFELNDGQLQLFRQDGTLFLTEIEMAEQLEAERDRADAERYRANVEQYRANSERDRANNERDRANAERDRADRLAERLRQLGVSDVDA